MSNLFASNPVLNKLPKHLFQFISPQNYEKYTSINQATWRYVMRQNIQYLSKVAHESYLDGLKTTGISIDAIPNMYGMNRILQEIGWAAIAVNGFIPPAVFMEFQAYNVLVIASDIRQIENIEYTPAPDIIHEAAGHAPIIANPEYAEYLRRFGEIGSKAVSSMKDYEMYEAVRHLSNLKEIPETTSEEIELAEKKIAYLQDNMGEPSEMSRIRNLHWWTVEYGLVGSLKNPKIYGAGLLSSIGESRWCLSDKVKKKPYDISAAEQIFDITQPQPQLYVTPNFAHLNFVLEEFANTMALRRGGLKGVQKLIDSQKLGTIELNTEIQVSGIFTQVISDVEEYPSFIQTVGPTALAYRNIELIGHGTKDYPQGFGSPIGKLKGISLAIEDMSPRDLEAYDICEGKEVSLEFEGNVTLTGDVVTGTRNLAGKVILITFKNCLVRFKKKILFKPEWGIYHLVVGKEITSAFAGPADKNSFDLKVEKLSVIERNPHKSDTELNLEHLYKSVRGIREGEIAPSSLLDIYDRIQNDFSNEWLLLLEIYEVAYHKKLGIAEVCLQSLEKIKKTNPSNAYLIDAGLRFALSS